MATQGLGKQRPVNRPLEAFFDDLEEAEQGDARLTLAEVTAMVRKGRDASR